MGGGQCKRWDQAVSMFLIFWANNGCCINSVATVDRYGKSEYTECVQSNMSLLGEQLLDGYNVEERSLWYTSLSFNLQSALML